MNSELFEYSKNVFQDKDIIKFIIANLAYTITFNQPCKTIFLIGDVESIDFFLKLLKNVLREKIVLYKDYKQTNFYHLRYCQFLVFQEDDNIADSNAYSYSYSKIIINNLDNLYYLSDSELIIEFRDSDYTLDLPILSREFDITLSKFINIGLMNKNMIYYYIDNNTKENRFLLYNSFLKSNYIYSNMDIEHIYKKICSWCNKIYPFNHVKEYLINIFGKPDYYEGWYGKEE